MITHPEILAPGGDPDSVRAAILAGADAVYLGLPRFNARMRSQNIDLKELSVLAGIAHGHGVRIYVTLNVLLAPEELPDALQLALDAIGVGADALILQDWGLLGLLNRVYPDIETHASTQLTTHNSRQLGVLSELGIRQVNLCRELSIGEVWTLTQSAHTMGMKTEVFVHGAYCISFSGQCYMSSFLCGLSGNRGSCVQPCRRKYIPQSAAETAKGRLQGRPAAAPPANPETAPAGRISTASRKPGSSTRRNISSQALVPLPALNLKDNNALELAQELRECGIDSFKIEGRRKGFFYVHSIVSAWRRELLALESPRKRAHSPERVSSDSIVGSVFHRGFHAGYLKGDISPEMFSDSDEDRSLVPLGKVKSYHADRGILKTQENLTPLQLDKGMAGGIFLDERQEQFITQVVVEERLSSTTFRVRLEHELKGYILPGQFLFAIPNYVESQALLPQLAQLKAPLWPLRIVAEGTEGLPLSATFIAQKLAVLRQADRREDAAGLSEEVKEWSAKVQSTILLQPAERNPLTATLLGEHFGKLGHTCYELTSQEGSLDVSRLGRDLFLPIRELNEMRRQAVSLLDAQRIDSAKSLAPLTTAQWNDLFCSLFTACPSKSDSRMGSLKQVSPLPQRLFSQEILPILDNPEDIALVERLGLSFFGWEIAHQKAIPEKDGLIPWFPAIILDEDFPFFDELLDRRAWPLIVSENSGLGWHSATKGIPWIAGPLLNITNAWACMTLHQSAGAQGAIFSTELGDRQVKAITGQLDSLKPTQGENFFATAAVAFGPILAMNTRQCLVRRFKHCRQRTCDRQCFLSCEGQGFLKSGQAEGSFFAAKNPGMFHRLWDTRLLLTPDLFFKANRTVDLVLVDLRNPGFLPYTSQVKEQILNAAIAENGKEIGSILNRNNIAFTSGHFENGLT